MTPIRFGPPAQQLFGVFHAASHDTAHPKAVLLCSPWGQEAVRTHRMFRVLAEKLSRAGWNVLRFDYFGTGESAGEDAQGHLAQWQDDILLAHQELQRRTFGANISWLGVRLGGSLACLVAHRAMSAPVHLVMWEPVLDGPAYVQALAASQPKALQMSFGVVPPKYRQLPPTEMLGFGMGPQLRAELAALTPSAFSAPLALPSITIIGPAQLASKAQALCHQFKGFEHAFDWTSEEALNTALVPHEALQQLFDSVASQPLVP
jgi:uncharacterized protein